MAERAKNKEEEFTGPSMSSEEKEPFNGIKGTEKLPVEKKKSVVETTEKVTIQSKYHFSPQELRNTAKALAETHSDLAISEDEKRASMSNFKDKIDRIKLSISTLSRNYRDGFEIRDYF